MDLLLLFLMATSSDLKDTILNNIDLVIDLISIIFLVTIVVLIGRLSDLFEVMQDALERNADGTSI